MDLIRDVLDKRVVDRNGRELGRVDGIALEQRDGQPPRVSALLIGPSVLGHRLSPRLGRGVVAIEAAFGIGKDRPTRIEFSQVLDCERRITVDLAFDDTSAGVIERKLRKWIVALTGSK